MKKKEELSLNKLEYTVLDVETTGLSPKTNRVIEIGLVKIKDEKVTDSFRSFFNPFCQLPTAITKLTGITDDDLYDAPTFSDLIFQINQFIGDSIIIAHNSQFDISFLQSEYLRAEENFVPNPVLCTLKLSRKLFPFLESKSLKDVGKHLQIRHKDLHRALSDATLTAKIFIKMIGILSTNLLISDLNDLLSFQQLPSTNNPNLLIKKGIGNDFVNLPDSPGVYIFKNSKDKVLYIGKSKSLKQRVTNHLSKTAGKKSKDIIKKSSSIEYKETHSELTALLAESQLIKFYLPKYNVMLKNYSSNYFIKVRLQHYAPDVSVVQEMEFDGNDYFGPYHNRETAKNLVDIIDKTFLLRECTDRVIAKNKQCYLLDINRCSGICLPDYNKEDYNKEINNVYDFLSGHNQYALNRLLEKMKILSDKQKYEEAAEIRDIVNSLLKQLTKSSIISEPINKAKVLVEVNYTQKKDYILLVEGKIFIKDYILNEKEFFEDALDDYFNNTINVNSHITQKDLDHIKIALTWLVYNRTKVIIHYLCEYATKDELINKLGIPKTKLIKKYNKQKKAK
ncbi:MAG: exonuclease domain-containing protein [bacterium]